MRTTRATEQVRDSSVPAMSVVPAASPESGTWVLQAEAAERTGFSISAIRKWRRSGVVAVRVRTTANGLARVEVRLEDILARSADRVPNQTRDRPGPRAIPAAPDSLPAGSVLVPLADLEALFERVAGAEPRAAEA